MSTLASPIHMGWGRGGTKGKVQSSSGEKGLSASGVTGVREEVATLTTEQIEDGVCGCLVQTIHTELCEITAHHSPCSVLVTSNMVHTGQTIQVVMTTFTVTLSIYSYQVQYAAHVNVLYTNTLMYALSDTHNGLCVYIHVSVSKHIKQWPLNVEGARRTSWEVYATHLLP